MLDGVPDLGVFGFLTIITKNYAHTLSEFYILSPSLSSTMLQCYSSYVYISLILSRENSLFFIIFYKSQRYKVVDFFIDLHFLYVLFLKNIFFYKICSLFVVVFTVRFQIIRKFPRSLKGICCFLLQELVLVDLVFLSPSVSLSPNKHFKMINFDFIFFDFNHISYKKFIYFLLEN